MDVFTETEIIELALFSVAFLIGVGVCTFIAIKETIELKKRRKAKRLIYEETVRMEMERLLLERQREQAAAAAKKAPNIQPVENTSPDSTPSDAPASERKLA